MMDQTTAASIVSDVCARLFTDDGAAAALTSVLSSHEGRPYHGPAHLASMCVLFEAVEAFAVEPEAVLLAILYHDRVQDLQTNGRSSGEHERASAQACLAVRDLLRNPSLAEAAATMILATSHHRSEDPDARLLIDLDLAILGADEAEFDAYEASVRVDAAAWRTGRAAVLRALLDRGTIYLTAAFSGLEWRARRNIGRSLARIKEESARFDATT